METVQSTARLKPITDLQWIQTCPKSMSLRASAIFRGSSCVKLASLILAMSLRASSIFRRNSDIVRWWSYTCVDVWASPPRHLVISRTLGDEAVDERRFGDRPARSIGQRSSDEHTRKGHARAGGDASRAAPRLQAGVPRVPRATSSGRHDSRPSLKASLP